MGFIIADGFDDRWILNNGDGYGYYYDGWGLYDDLYHGADYIHADYKGVREMGRYGGWIMTLTDDEMSYSYCAIEKTLSSGKNWCGGAAINSLDEDCSIVSFKSGATRGPEIEFDVAGEVSVRNSTGVIHRSDKSARLTMWGAHYLTFQFHAGDAGSDWIKIWIDGELVLDEASTTLNTVGALDYVEFPDSANAIDDMWLRDDTSVITPEVRIPAIFPNAAGDDAECAPVGSASNYLNVDEFEQDFDDTYNLVDAGEKDSFNMESITAIISAGIVHALVARFFVKGDVGNTEDIRPYVVSGGTKYNGTQQSVVEGRYTYIQEIWETDPDTSAAWILADLDTVQIGYEAV